MPNTRELRVQPLGELSIRNHNGVMHPRFLADVADRLIERCSQDDP